MLENSKGFDGKLVGMQVICRTNIQTVPRDIYGIYSGDILYHVVILFWRVRPRNLFVFLPGQTGMVGVVKNMITQLRYPLGCQGHFFSVGFWEEVVIFGNILILVEASGHIPPSGLPLKR